MRRNWFPVDYPHKGHIAWLNKRFDGRMRAARPAEGVTAVDGAIAKTLFICFANRTGSNYLAAGLRASGLVSGGREFFLKNAIDRVSAEQGLTSFEDYCRHVVSAHSEPGKVLAVKTSWDMLFYLTETGILDDVFPDPHFVVVRRRDLLAQAVSFDIASQTKQWKSTASPQFSGEVEFFPPRIPKRIVGAANALTQFYIYMALFGHDYYEAIYEHFENDLEGSVAGILSWAGIAEHATLDMSQIEMKAQRTDVNRRYRERVIEYCRKGPRGPSTSSAEGAPAAAAGRMCLYDVAGRSRNLIRRLLARVMAPRSG